MKTTDAPVARLLNVSKVFTSGDQKTCAVNAVSLDFFPGEMVVLLGPSGSGKTTLLTTLAGLLPPTSGEVMLFGRPVSSYRPSELQHVRAARIGFVFQTFLLMEALTVEGNISIVTRFIERDRNGIEGEITSILDHLNIAHLARKYPAELSQGEKQRVAIARAIVNKPDLIIADEPTASVDAKNGAEIIRLFRGFAREENRCVLITSHDRRVISYADRVVEMEDGRVIGKGAASHPPSIAEPVGSPQA